MTRKRSKKLLMSLGYSRNEAESIVKNAEIGGLSHFTVFEITLFSSSEGYKKDLKCKDKMCDICGEFDCRFNPEGQSSIMILRGNV